jgi:flagellar biosynthesis/type III secretory pathway protein FliH
VDKKCWSNVLKAGAAWPMVKRRPAASGSLPPAGLRSGAGVLPRLGLSLEQAAVERLEAEQAALVVERTRLEQAASFLETCAQCLTDAREAAVQDVEQQLMDLVMKVATQVIHDEVTQRPELIRFQVQAALARVKEDGMMTVRVHPLMLDIVRDASQDITASVGRTARLHFEPDPSIAAGGCMVETTHQIVDARIASQLTRISTALKQDLST